MDGLFLAVLIQEEVEDVLVEEDHVIAGGEQLGEVVTYGEGEGEVGELVVGLGEEV